MMQFDRGCTLFVIKKTRDSCELTFNIDETWYTNNKVLSDKHNIHNYRIVQHNSKWDSHHGKRHRQCYTNSNPENRRTAAKSLEQVNTWE
jgi:hypothetical protein